LLFASAGLLSFAATPPFGLGFLAFVSLVPLLHAVRRSSGYWAAAVGGGIAGCALFFPGLFWLTDVTALGWVVLALYCASYLLVFALFAFRMSHLPPFRAAAALSAFWIILEYVRGLAFTGFPWLLLSHTQGSFTAFMQVADVIGAYGLSGVIVAVNVLVYECIYRISRREQRWAQILKPAIASLAIVLIASGYGYYRMQKISTRTTHRIAAVQASIPQEMKQTLAGHYDPGGVLKRYLAASTSIPADQSIDLIVWPETVLLFPYTINVSPEALDGEYQEAARIAQSALADLAKRHKSYLLIGATTYLPSSYGYVLDRAVALRIPPGAWQQRYNSAILLDPSGKYSDRYDKIHLVPFGEYVPLPTLAPFLAKLVPFESSLIRGEKQTIFQVGHNGTFAKFGVLICYEDTDPKLARNIRKSGADYLVNISNDAWFGTNELDQHLVAAQFRAIENRVGLLRSGNNGFTVVIDPFGRVSSDSISKDAIGHLVAQVSTTDAHTIYTRFGDFPVLVTCIVLVAIGMGSRRQNRRSDDIRSPALENVS
jgi:apolipoprotein N-acyltransferase